MKHQSDKMRASLTRFEFCNKEEEKKETDKELSDDDNSDN
tara:strand:+ start:715 stop:834 length:120 start_codon:yes stop_codon:yes gene_type:complete